MYVHVFNVFPDNNVNSAVIIAIVVIVIVLILCCFVIMNILFCYCCKRREQNDQNNGKLCNTYSIYTYVCVMSLNFKYVRTYVHVVFYNSGCKEIGSITWSSVSFTFSMCLKLTRSSKCHTP